jgi:UDP-N-acetylglucosamine:LPS N-acetylglucosamine transferase
VALPDSEFHTMKSSNPKIVAISSGGGHWVQLLRLRPAFEGCDVVFATVKEGYRSQVDGAEFRVIPDANRWNKLALLRTAIAIFRLLRRERPDIVISTGAAPGFFAIFLAKYVGARSIWVDSVANAEELSLSGKKAGKYADLWLTQWPHLAVEGGPKHFGSVL